MKIVLDIDRLLQEGRITADEYERLRLLGASDTGRLAFNVLIGFGVIAVAGGLVALLQSVEIMIGLGIALALLGGFLGLSQKEHWGVLGSMLLIVGSLTAGGGILALTEGSAAGFLLVSCLYVAGAILAKSGLLAALSVFGLLAAIGGMTGYHHAVYWLAIEQPSLTIVLFGVLALVTYWISLTLPADYERLALIYSRTSLFFVNFGFWIGSLWGDRLGRDRSMAGPAIPDLVFVVGWGVSLLAVGVWAARRNRRFVVNLAATFGAIHFYTQWFERLGANPGSILVAGVIALAIAFGVLQYNRHAAAMKEVSQPWLPS